MANIGGNNTNVTRKPTEIIKDNVKLMKAIFNYFQPLSIWNETVKQMKEITVQPNTPESELSPEDKLYLIMCTTRDYLSHLFCLIDTEYVRQMHSNIYNLYNIFGVDLKKKAQQDKQLTDTLEEKYYYFIGYVNYTKITKPISEVKRLVINEKIKELIKRAHSKESQNPQVEITDVHSKSIILFCHLLHHLVGTMDTKWKGITNYFISYYSVALDDPIGNQSPGPSDPRNQPGIKIKIQRIKKTGQFESDAENLENHWQNMNDSEENQGLWNNIMIIGFIICAVVLAMLKKFIYGE